MFKQMSLTTMFGVCVSFLPAEAIMMDYSLDKAIKEAKDIAINNPKKIQDKYKDQALGIAQTYYVVLSSLNEFILPTTKFKSVDTTKLEALVPWFEDIKSLDSAGINIDVYSSRKELRDNMLKTIASSLKKINDFMASNCYKYDRAMFEDMGNVLEEIRKDFYAILLQKGIGFTDEDEKNMKKLLKAPIDNQKAIEEILSRAINHKIDFLKIISLCNRPLSVVEFLSVSTIKKELPAIIKCYSTILNNAKNGVELDSDTNYELGRLSSRYSNTGLYVLPSIGIVISSKKKEQLNKVLQDCNAIMAKYQNTNSLQLQGRVDKKSGEVSLTTEECEMLKQALEDIDTLQKGIESLINGITIWDVASHIGFDESNGLLKYGPKVCRNIVFKFLGLFKEFNDIATQTKVDANRYVKTQVENIFEHVRPFKNKDWAKKIETNLLSINYSDDNTKKIRSAVAKQSKELMNQCRAVEHEYDNGRYLLGSSYARSLLRNVEKNTKELCELIEQLGGEKQLR